MLLESLNAGAGLAETASNIWAAKTNADSLAWQKKQYKISQEREDTAVQRRMEDLRAAGLSPTLAAGSAASASMPPTPMKVDGVKMDTRLLDSMALMKMKADISKTRADEQKVAAETVGQEIANKFAQETNPITTQTKGVELALLEETKPEKVREIVAKVEGMGIDNANKLIDTEIKKNQVTQGAIDIVKTKIENQALQQGMSEKDIDIAAKTIAVRIKGIEEEEKRFNVDAYKSLGIPTTGGLDPMTRGGSVVGNALGNLIGKIKSSLPSPRKKETYLEAYRRAMK